MVPIYYVGQASILLIYDSYSSYSFFYFCVSYRRPGLVMVLQHLHSLQVQGQGQVQQQRQVDLQAFVLVLVRMEWLPFLVY
jgi:hypothetical protein